MAITIPRNLDLSGIWFITLALVCYRSIGVKVLCQTQRGIAKGSLSFCGCILFHPRLNEAKEFQGLDFDLVSVRITSIFTSERYGKLRFDLPLPAISHPVAPHSEPPAKRERSDSESSEAESRHDKRRALDGIAAAICL
jgi:hypothetical protein